MYPDRIYRHFCMTARALEVVGERWSLLIVRDLLFGPRRFTDLARSLNEITPTRLTGRLRQLQAAGIVVREPLGGREIQYRLTDAGLALGPAIEALTLWGIEHALEPPRGGEPVTPEPAMLGTKVWLDRYSAPPTRPISWVWRFPDDDYFTLGSEGSAWALARGKAESARVTVVASPSDWAAFLTTPRQHRRLPLEGIELQGRRADLQQFAKAFMAKLGRG